MKHVAIYLSNTDDKLKIIAQLFKVENAFSLGLKGKGLLFSTTTIEQLIDEERKHDAFVVTSSKNKSIESMSSGEQKKALLNYLLQQHPNYLVLDDLFGSLDVDSLHPIKEILAANRHEIRIVQLCYRKQDLLPFIDEVIRLDKLMQISKTFTLQSFLQLEENSSSISLNLFPTYHLSKVELKNPLIELKNVTVKYEEKPVLKNINRTINKGEFWQLKGANGTGKTTLVSMIIGDNPKAYGQNMILFGRKKGTGESVWDIKKNIGYFYPTMTMFFSRNDSVENMIISGLVDSIGLYIVPTEFHKTIAKAWLDFLGKDYSNKRFEDLTAGQQRIVLVIRAIVKQPALLILDEPTVGLDDENAQLFTALINQLVALKNMAIIYISHREELHLKPQKIMQLITGEQGSTNVVV